MTKSFARRTVHVVDDEPKVLKALVQTIESLGCKVTGHASAASCLTALAKEPADLVVTDMNMPKKDGMSLLKEVKKTYPALPVIIITGFGDVPVAVEAMRSGAADFIEKPFEEEPLLESVKKQLLPKEMLDDITLTEMEIAVLRHVASGRSSKEIAEKLGRSNRTIENIRFILLKKFRVENTANLIKMALKMGIYPFFEED